MFCIVQKAIKAQHITNKAKKLRINSDFAGLLDGQLLHDLLRRWEVFAVLWMVPFLLFVWDICRLLLFLLRFRDGWSAVFFIAGRVYTK
jgi:hypothetical protein